MKNKPYALYNNCPEYGTIRELLLQSAAKYTDAPAFSYRNRASDTEKVVVSFREFSGQARALGTELYRRGLGGAHCALIGKLSYGWILSYFSLLSIGAVLVPLDPEWSAEDLTKTIQDADCSFIICDQSVAEKLPDICAQSKASAVVLTSGQGAGGKRESVFDLAAAGRSRLIAGDSAFDDAPIDANGLSLLVFTSGTTGQGKGVMLSQKAILSNIAEGLKIAVIGKKLIGVLPPHHTFGSTIGILAPVCLGGELYISSGVKYIARELQQEQPEGLILVPLYLETFYRKICANIRAQGKERLVTDMMMVSNLLRRGGINLTGTMFRQIRRVFGGKLEVVICGGAPLSRDVYHLFSSLGITLMNGYGITECAPLISVNRNQHIIPGTVGMPIPCDTVKIDAPNEDGEGEICVKGPNVMLGYYKNEAATRAAIDSDGFFHTGDIGKLHPSGYICITGRSKNLIILSNGKNVYPEEIESEFSSVPGLLDIVVYEGKSRRGVEYNRIVAEVYLDPEFVETEKITDQRAYMQPYLEAYNKTAVPYKKVAILRVRNEPFPKNTLRKIVRFRLDMSIE